MISLITFSWVIDRIIDGNGGGVAADATSNPKIVFTTEACPNNNPSLLVDSGNTSPVNGATNIDPSTTSLYAQFTDIDGDDLTLNVTSYTVRRVSDDQTVGFYSSKIRTL